MKLTVCLLAIFGCSFALPSPALDPFETLPWEEIRGENVYIEPLENYTIPDVPDIDGRVVGGSEVARNSVPYQVGIFIDGRSFCGGSLISRTFVLTAAHCTISASSVQLVFGAHAVQSSESTQVRVTSRNIINHGQYNPSNLRNDISLVRLVSAINTNSNIQIIPLAPANSGTFAGTTAFLTGWGRISDSNTAIATTLRGVNVPVITNAVCANTYGTNVVVASTLCTSGANGRGACQGDSGGPLVVQGVQIAVTSFVASAGCQRSLPSGFARVSNFRSWISQNTGV